MSFLISLCIVLFLISIGRNFIKKHSNFCYIITFLISTSLIVLTYSGIISNAPSWLKNYILPLFSKSSLATSFFVVVMYTGALKNGSKAIKFLMPIRAQLSIIGCILALTHNIIYGRTHFVTLFTNPKSMSTNMIMASIVSILLILIMLPLMITSFPKVRKKMKAKSWKKLQQLAYPFYGLIYLHVMIIAIPLAKKGITQYIINVLAYSIVFLIYASMRIRKALLKNKVSKKKASSPIFASIIVFALVCVSIFYTPKIDKDIQSSTSLSQKDSSTEDKILNEDSENVDAEVATEIPSSQSVTYVDGTYTGTSSGYNGNISVEVTVSNNTISDIKITKYVDDEPFIDEAISGVTENIINSQNTDVDTVSGATFSSKGIINAVKAALINAKG